MSSEDLSQIPLLRNVSPTLLARLTGHLTPFSRGEAILSTGDQPKYIALIRSGEVAVKLNGIQLVTRKRDDIVGEQAFINDLPHSADCIAVTSVQAISMPVKTARMFLADGAFVRNLLMTLSDKLRDSTLERYMRFGTEERLFSEFRSHVSREVLTELLNSGANYGAPRHVDDVVVLFSDIRGFSAYVHQAEAANALTVAHDLSSYLSEATDVIHRRHGFVDKFIGDAIMAFWGYPGLRRVANDEILVCAEELVALAHRHRFGGEPVVIGVGINQGRCFMGNIGSAEKRQFTILGDVVNVAARLEAVTKERGTIVIGSTFFDRLSPASQARFTPSIKDLPGVGRQELYSL